MRQRWVVIERTEEYKPGTPYVHSVHSNEEGAVLVAEWAARSSAVEVHREDAMRGDPELAPALKAWETGDSSVLCAEIRAIRAAEEAEGSIVPLPPD